MKVYGYIRLNEQRAPKTSFLSLEKQTQMIRDYAAEHQLELEEIIEDSEVTSASLKMPGIQKVLELARNHEMDALIIARMDRVTRTVRLFNEFLEKIHIKHKVRFISVEEELDSGTESGALAMKVINIIGKWDLKMISDRTKDLIERKREVGESVGHAPFGYVYLHKKLVPHIPELKIVHLILEKRDNDSLSYHKIARYLNEHMIPSKRGGKWYAETVKTIYENPLYKEQEIAKIIQAS
ncbi:MAG: recombinase family protein [SAR324 cluster bacterium]|nr:recombinase family protein [SAR324 cluster bacterium]